VLAFPDRAACAERLPEGQPALRGIAMLDHRTPQDQYIDPAIGPPGQRVARQACRRAIAPAPRLHPWQPARFQFGDDALGHLDIEVVGS
jgi:hypothetical protein